MLSYDSQHPRTQGVTTVEISGEEVENYEPASHTVANIIIIIIYYYCYYYYCYYCYYTTTDLDSQLGDSDEFVLRGYNVDTLTIDQVTPLHEACLGDHVGCARILLEAGANVNATTIDGVTPLFNACSRGSAACTELLLQYGAKAQWESCLPSPTHEAASRGHSECLEVLISWGIDVDQDLPHLGTPLYVACVSQQIHCIRKLLYTGANVQKGKHLQTPLHAAAQHSSTEIVNLLLEFGADINAKNSDFKRPVDLAAPSSLVEGLLLFHEATPSSLCQLCRLSIRNYLGRARLHLVPQLQLPTILKNFLQYR
ncbi:Ankyrin repeat and SOCS box protein 5 [Turdus rufiventris]|nr:Ankyrin repeat and SOCS box protein 5 [Turdus rufiventris]